MGGKARGEDSDGVVARPTTGRVSSRVRRDQYLQVAADIVIDQGVDAVTMDAVAAGVGVNKALLYRQFSNRGDLLLVLWEQETSELDRRVLEAVDAVETFEEKLRAWVHVWFGYMGRRGRLLFRLMDARAVAAGTVGQRQRERQRSIDRVYGAWWADVAGLSDETGTDAAAILMAGLTGAIERWVASPTAATRQRLEDTYVDMVLGSLQQLAHTHGGRAGEVTGVGAGVSAKAPAAPSLVADAHGATAGNGAAANGKGKATKAATAKYQAPAAGRHASRGVDRAT